jgi:hypothetical protein
MSVCDFVYNEFYMKHRDRLVLYCVRSSSRTVERIDRSGGAPFCIVPYCDEQDLARTVTHMLKTFPTALICAQNPNMNNLINHLMQHTVDCPVSSG